MCHYDRKVHICGCLSRVQLVRCKDAILTSTVCTDLEVPPFDPSELPKSLFACYDCLRAEAVAEADLKMQDGLAQDSIRGDGPATQEHTEENEGGQKTFDGLAYKEARSENMKEAAEECASMEKENEEKDKAKKLVDMERTEREGLLSVDVGSPKKIQGHPWGTLPAFATMKTPKPAAPALSAASVLAGHGVAAGGGGQFGRGGGGFSRMGEFGLTDAAPKPINFLATNKGVSKEVTAAPSSPRESGSWRGTVPKMILKRQLGGDGVVNATPNVPDLTPTTGTTNQGSAEALDENTKEAAEKPVGNSSGDGQTQGK